MFKSTEKKLERVCSATGKAEDLERLSERRDIDIHTIRFVSVNEAANVAANAYTLICFHCIYAILEDHNPFSATSFHVHHYFLSRFVIIFRRVEHLFTSAVKTDSYHVCDI